MTKQSRIIARSGAALAVVILSIAIGGGGSPGTRSSGSPDDVDYCNVLLVPKVAEQIGLDLPMRIRMAKRGERALDSLLNRNGRDPSMAISAKVAEQSGTSTAVRAGKWARETLPADAREKFDEMFGDGKLIHVGLQVRKAEKKGFSGSGLEVILAYGLYEEEKDRVSQKSMRGESGALSRCYTWIRNEEEAKRLLEHEEKDVQLAAELWFARNETASNPAEEILARHKERLEENRRLAEESTAQSMLDRQLSQQQRRDAAADRHRRTSEFEAAMAEHERKMAEFRRKMDERRRESEGR